MTRESTGSTAASASDLRQVRFRDGLTPGSEEAAAVWTAVADWIFIDRDICGMSLHEYDPDGEVKDFASSPYGRDFLHSLDFIVSMNAFEEAKAARCTGSMTAYKVDERELDKALFTAGVHVNTWLHIHQATKEVTDEEPTFFEVSI